MTSTKKKDDDLQKLLSQLALERWPAKPGPKFQLELGKTKFTIFACISDLGYYQWTPSGTYRSLATVTADEIKRQTNTSALPDKLVPVASIYLPQAFRSLPPKEHINKYPYGRSDIAALYVAARHRNVRLEDIDFLFGGSTLEFLANHDPSHPFYTTRVPGSRTIMIVKCHEYVQNYAEVGFQFERLVTGKRMDDMSDTASFLEHLHILQIGTYRVLFRAEVDAMADDEPVEVKASNPTYWGSKVVFQMISSGSPTLCHGFKRRGRIDSISLKSLSSLAASQTTKSLETNILKAMKELQENVEEGKVYQIFFSSATGEVIVTPREGRSGSSLLPPDDVVKELLTGSHVPVETSTAPLPIPRS